MSELTNKHILLCITGGIAAYKCPDLVRRLIENGATVRVAITSAGREFVTSKALQAVTGHPVYDDQFQSQEDGMEHISLARWADLILIAPATANCIAKLNHGIADDFVSTLCLAADCPIAVAPAMNQSMWSKVITQQNVSQLAARGVHIFGPGSGEQACGETGKGRMLEPLELVSLCSGLFMPRLLANKTVMITAGPTQESLDPVRFLSNHSSGKMGFALAKAASLAGANVILISGPVNIPIPADVQYISTRTAVEMRDAVMSHVSLADIFIAAAAVSDYRPKSIAEEKIKKHDQTMQIELVRNPDILADVAAMQHRPFCVGFAAETENLDSNAQEKLERKDIDMIAANWVGDMAKDSDTGFDSDDNALHVFTRENETFLRKNSKTNLAKQLIKLIADRYYETNTA